MVGPAVWSALFAYSIESLGSFPLDFHLTFYVKAMLRLVVACLAWNMSKVEDRGHTPLKDGEQRRTDDERDLELM